MKLEELINVLGEDAKATPVRPKIEVLDITNDSRKVRRGSLFVAVRGFHSDGHQFIPQAVKQGAAAVVAESGRIENVPGDVPVIRVADSRAALALISDAFYGHPSRRLKLIGITGTNGKTTTTYLVKSIIEAAGYKAGLIGTIDYQVGNRVYPAPNTTPESLDLQRFLSEMLGQGAEYCVMEVSSHALALERTAGCEFAAAGFTNLTQDHLDFHEDMEAYFNAKLLLFTGLAADRIAVVNLDDAHAEKIMRATKARVITTGLSDKADIYPSGSMDHGMNGLLFTVVTPGGRLTIQSPLVGKHNIYNILSAIGIAAGLGLSPEAVENGIRNMKAVPGRMEKVDNGQPFAVIVDYAHTEDALVRLLEAITEIAHNRIITVFGCGGDRDRTKRPRMGAAAAQGSDVVIVTSDNPRSENPLDIIREIETGMTSCVKMEMYELQRGGTGSRSPSKKKPYYVIPDRAEAIGAAIGLAGPGDVVVLAGKGHEDYQIISNKKIRFDDREIARQAIKKLQNAE